MNRVFLILSFLAAHFTYAQQSYWQQQTDYTIDVVLDDANHTLKGVLQLAYTNHSPDTLTYIWFHLWPNAYKNENTAFAQQLFRSDDGKGRWKAIKDKGFMEQHVQITTPFFVKLPTYNSRSGHDGQSYMVCQWYPKPAVYDRKGWHAMPYLDQGEFYSEYGNFKVNITVPSAYVVGATGMLQNSEELAVYKRLGQQNKGTARNTKYTPTATGNKTLSYVGENIHDFAWFADKDFIIEYDTLHLNGKKTIDVFAYHQPKGNKHWESSTDYIKSAVEHYSRWIGEYPYPTVAAVEGPKNDMSGGMEYPMITLITSPNATEEYLDAVITHEVGHNWFYSILGSNERQHAWMDEGLNTYYQFRYEAEKYRANSIFGDQIPASAKKLTAEQFAAAVFEALSKFPMEKPIDTPAEAFTDKNDYAIVEYIKTSLWMYLIEQTTGKDALDKGMQLYFSKWKFKHPYPEDLKAAFEEAMQTGFNAVFSLLGKEGALE